MIITTQVKCSLVKLNEKMLIDAIKKGTHDFDDLIALVNDLVDDAFQRGINYDADDNK
jgi:hypothetical protein